MSPSSFQQLYMDFDGEFPSKNIIDLRAEFAEIAVHHGLRAQEQSCNFTFDIDKFTPRFFHGNPQKLREILLTLIEISLLAENVNTINIRLGSRGDSTQYCHRLKIIVTCDGRAIPPCQLNLFDSSPQPLKRNSSVNHRNNHKISRVNELLRQLDGNLYIENSSNIYKYIARFNLPEVIRNSVV